MIGIPILLSSDIDIMQPTNQIHTMFLDVRVHLFVLIYFVYPFPFSIHHHSLCICSQLPEVLGSNI
jgi:hypothetical protein